jgi:hypothetical protein
VTTLRSLLPWSGPPWSDVGRTREEGASPEILRQCHTTAKAVNSATRSQRLERPIDKELSFQTCAVQAQGAVGGLPTTLL